jgi:hypothetical protein
VLPGVSRKCLKLRVALHSTPTRFRQKLLNQLSLFDRFGRKLGAEPSSAPERSPLGSELRRPSPPRHAGHLRSSRPPTRRTGPATRGLPCISPRTRESSPRSRSNSGRYAGANATFRSANHVGNLLARATDHVLAGERISPLDPKTFLVCANVPGNCTIPEVDGILARDRHHLCVLVTEFGTNLEKDITVVS